jgi:CRP/FNR family cyclic AMP-dependent transcriptional regulator
MEGQVALGEIPFFKALPVGDLMAILKTTKTLPLKGGETLFHKGDKGDGLYAVLSGELHVYLPATVHSPIKSLKKLSPGQYVGEFALFDGEPRSASVEASKDSEVMFLPVMAFAALLESHSSVARAVVDHLGQTLMNHPHSGLNEFERDLIVESKVPPNLKFIQLLCRLLRKANLAVATNSR